MVINHACRVAGRPAAKQPVKATEVARVSWLDRLRRFWCGARGHDVVLSVEARRLYLHCASCGYESPGWDISGRPPQLRYTGDPQRHQLVATRALMGRPATALAPIKKTA